MLIEQIKLVRVVRNDEPESHCEYVKATTMDGIMEYYHTSQFGGRFEDRCVNRMLQPSRTYDGALKFWLDRDLRLVEPKSGTMFENKEVLAAVIKGNSIDLAITLEQERKEK